MPFSLGIFLYQNNTTELVVDAAVCEQFLQVLSQVSKVIDRLYGKNETKNTIKLNLCFVSYTECKQWKKPMGAVL